MTTKRLINYLLALPLEHFSPCSFKFSSSSAMPSWKITWASSYLCMVSLHCLSTVWSVQETHLFLWASHAATQICRRRVPRLMSALCVDVLLDTSFCWPLLRDRRQGGWAVGTSFVMICLGTLQCFLSFCPTLLSKKATDIPWHSLWIYSNGLTVVLFPRR
jgi:cytochrome bd-type quinol oxidase subunit 2